MIKFTPNERVQKAREKLFELFSTKPRGELVKHEQIEKAIGFKRFEKNTPYYAIVQTVAKMHLEKRGISILNEVMIGYTLATPEQQLHILAEKTRRGRRQISRGCAAVESLPDDDVTNHQRQVRDALVVSGRDAMRVITQANRLNEFLMRRKPGEPLRIVKRNDNEQTETA